MHILTLPSTLNNFLFPQLQRSAPQLVSAYVIHDDDVAHAPHASSAWVAFISGSAKNGSTHFACLIFNLPTLCKNHMSFGKPSSLGSDEDVHKEVLEKRRKHLISLGFFWDNMSDLLPWSHVSSSYISCHAYKVCTPEVFKSTLEDIFWCDLRQQL